MIHRGVIGELLPAVISGLSAAAVAVLGALVSYWFSTRTSRRELAGKLQEIRATGLQDRITAEREYQLEAMKAFRTAVGGPKGQIVESVHDLSDRLAMLFRARAGGGRGWDLLKKSEFYRRNTCWLILRPFVWIDILRGRLVMLDQTLGELLSEEFRFLNYCRLLERALTERELFAGTDYRWPEIAHVWWNQLRFITEQLTRSGNLGPTSVSYSQFIQGEPTEEVLRVSEDFLRDTGARGRLGELRRARFIALHAACNVFLEQFRLPYRQVESAEESMKYLESLSSGRREPIRENLRELLSQHEMSA